MKVFTVSHNEKTVCEVSSPDQALTLIRFMDSVIHLSELIFTVRIIDTEMVKYFPKHSEVITLNTWYDAVTVIDRLSSEYPGYRHIFQNVAVQCSPEMARAVVTAHRQAF